MTEPDSGAEPAIAKTLIQRARAGLQAAFSDELLSYRRQFDSDEPDQHRVRNRKPVYRYLLIALAVMLAPINAYDYYSDRSLPTIGGVLLLFLFLSNTYLLARSREPFFRRPQCC